MLIILEGPDGGGKTTLANRIAQYITNAGHSGVIDVRNAGPTHLHPLDAYELPLVSYRPQHGGEPHIICDRWHLGEAVYPTVLGRETRWNIAIERHIYLFLKSRGAHVVGVLPPLAELDRRFTERGHDDLVSTGMLAELHKRYSELHTLAFDQVIDSDGFDAPVDVVSRALAKARGAQALAPFTTYVGPRRPLILIFGEKRMMSDRQRVRHRELRGMPAFCPYNSTSGHYLLTYLEVRGADIGLANACDVDDPIALWRTLGYPSVVALGRAASRRLIELNISHGAVPHPQYIRRFHHGHGHEYVHALLNAAYDQKDMLTWRP